MTSPVSQIRLTIRVLFSKTCTLIPYFYKFAFSGPKNTVAMKMNCRYLKVMSFKIKKKYFVPHKKVL